MVWGVAAAMGMCVLLGAVAPVAAQGRGGGRGGGSDWRARLEEMRRLYEQRAAERNGGAGQVVEPVKPVDGEAEGVFVKWSEGKDGGKDALMLTISDAEGKETATLICPNTDKVKGDKMNPDPDIVTVAKTLKIGDEVTVDYTFFKGRTTVRSVTQKKAGSAVEPFTFVGVAEVRRGKDKFLGVTARRSDLRWTFLIPNKEVSTATMTGPDGKPLGEGTMSAPAPRIVQALGTLRTGDLIDLQYSPDDFRFVLDGLSVSRISGTGKFERLSARLIGSKRHDMALIRVGDRSLPLVVPLDPADASAAEKAGGLSARLKALRPWQAVDVTYHREDGISWLDEMTIKP